MKTFPVGGHRHRAFVIVDAVPVKTDEGGESHRARHGADKRRRLPRGRQRIPRVLAVASRVTGGKDEAASPSARKNRPHDD
jgi:hypothetical protein